MSKIKTLAMVIAVLIILLEHEKAKGQTGLYIGLEAGETHSFFEVVSPYQTLIVKPAPRISFWGISLGTDINNTFRAETGMIKNTYYENYEILDSSFLIKHASGGLTIYQIPLRLKAQGRVLKSLFKSRLVVYSILGYHLGINTDFEKKTERQNLSWNVNGQIFTYNEESTRDYSFQRTFGLIEAGGGIDFYFGEKVSIFSNFSYTFGLRRLTETDIQYQINQGETKWARIVSNGTYRVLKFGLRYSII